MLWTIIGILFVLWIILLVMKVTTGLIHILLVIAVILLVVRFFTRKKV